MGRFDMEIEQPKPKQVEGFIGEQLLLQEKLIAGLVEQIIVIGKRLSTVFTPEIPSEKSVKSDRPDDSHSELGNTLIRHNMQLSGTIEMLVAMYKRVDL